MLKINSDGGSRGNPGEAAVGYVIRDDDKILKMESKKIGKATNNIAEYKALINALEKVKKSKLGIDMICYLDSELVVRQLNGSYKIKAKHLKPLFEKVKKLQEDFRWVKIRHVRRYDKFQQMADVLVNNALDGK